LQDLPAQHGLPDRLSVAKTFSGMSDFESGGELSAVLRADDPVHALDVMIRRYQGDS
jgi:hypothetical protein